MQDHPWLRVLLEERDRFIGRPQRELDARLREPLPCASPPMKLKLAVRVLAKLQRSRCTCAAVPPRKAREVLFQTAAREAASPSVVLARVAAELGVAPRELDESLFADLLGEKLLSPSASRLAGRSCPSYQPRAGARAPLPRREGQDRRRGAEQGPHSPRP